MKCLNGGNGWVNDGSAVLWIGIKMMITLTEVVNRNANGQL
ncbi:MAG: hypothetical protein ACTS4T_01195 [Candidatus Hodgkinia cicadicola]